MWEASEATLDEAGVPPPFWAFAWAGGQALARFVLDQPETVLGKRVLDFGSGSGIVGLAAIKAGAADVLAADLDPFAAVVAGMNATQNGHYLRTYSGDATALRAQDFDVILAADVCYDRQEANAATQWLRQAANSAVTVLLGDPERKYLPSDEIQSLATYEVPTSLALEKATVTATQVWKLSNPNFD
ncbi:MAG: class I SAM-dependent methyltransferase [Alphaproteobacteria bacterium]